MKKSRFWTAIFVILLPLALIGTMPAASRSLDSGLTQPGNEVYIAGMVSNQVFPSALVAPPQTTYNYTNSIPLEIPDEGCPTEVTSTLFVADSFLISDLNVGIWLDIFSRADIRLWLVSPNATQVELFQNQGTGENINALFDDDATEIADSTDHTIPPSPPNNFARWRPIGHLYDFNGQNAQGTWTIKACDSYARNPAGSLTNWRLSFTTGLGLRPAHQNGSACRNSAVVYDYTFVNATAAAQSFSITYTSTWPAAGPSASPVIAKGASWAFQVYQNVPWTANPGDTNTLTVSVSSLSGGISATAVSTAAIAQGWQDYTNSPTGRGTRYHSIVYWDGRLYKIGGYGGSTPATQAWLDIYNIAGDGWTQGADMPEARFGIDCVPIDLTGTEPKIYCAGGNLSGSTNTTYIYDINTNTWASGAEMPGNRYSYAGVVHNNLYYVIGGSNDFFQKTIFVYNPATNEWNNSLASMSTIRRSHSAGVIGDKIYVAGGLSGSPYNGDPVAAAEVYDIAGDNWSPIATMPAGWLNAADGVVNDRYLLMVGGYGAEQTASYYALIYDSVNDIWTSLPQFNHQIYGAEGDSDGTNFWVVSGRLYEGSFMYGTYNTLMKHCVTCNFLPLVIK